MCVIPNPSLADRRPTTVRMLSLNFNSETFNTGLQKRRLPLIEKYIRDNDLDIVLFQECWEIGRYDNFAKKLAEDLNMSVVSHFEDGLTGFKVTSISIVAKKGLQIRNMRAYKLPHSAKTIGDGRHFWLGLGEVNMLIGANITLPTGETASVWNAHLSTVKSKYRVDQVNFALAKIKELADYNKAEWLDQLTLFGGDLNSAPESPEMNILRGSKFIDLWQASHPFDPGHTIVGDPEDVEYNPIVHGSGQFPAQDEEEPTARIDYIYAHIPKPFYTTLGRVFTAPINNIWMSDHFGLRGEIDLAGAIPDQLPSADSDFSKTPPTQFFDVTEKNQYKLPDKIELTVSSERGLTVRNFTDNKVKIEFGGRRSQVYTSPYGTLSKNELTSYVFFTPGDYPCKISVSLKAFGGQEDVVDAIVHVKNGF